MRAYRAGPCGVEEPIAERFWQKYSAQLQATQALQLGILPLADLIHKFGETSCSQTS